MSFEKQLIDEINKVRASPNSYVSKLTESKTYFDKNIWKHPDIPRGIETKDGARAYENAISFLKMKATSVPQLTASKGLCDMAKEFLSEYQANKDAEPDLDAAIDRHGQASGYIKRLVEFGAHSPEQVVINLLVCDGDPGHGLRDALLLKDLKYVGVATGPHETMRTCTVIVAVTDFKNTVDSNDTPYL
jgi:hypothetical protein